MDEKKKSKKTAKGELATSIKKNKRKTSDSINTGRDSPDQQIRIRVDKDAPPTYPKNKGTWDTNQTKALNSIRKKNEPLKDIPVKYSKWAHLFREKTTAAALPKHQP